MLTDTEYLYLKTKYTQFQLWVNGRTSWYTADEPPELRVTSEERSEIEVYEFIKEKPTKYRCYIGDNHTHIITWTGQSLGRITWRYKCHRYYYQPREQKFYVVHALGINGVKYYGRQYIYSDDMSILLRARKKQ